MMKRIVLGLIGLCLSFVAVHAQTAAPAAAAAVGYNTLTYGPAIVVNNTVSSTSYPVPGPTGTNNNWYPFTFYGTSWQGIGFTRNSDQSITLDGSGEGENGYGLTTASLNGTSTANRLSFTGQTFGGGFYAQVTMQGNGPMAFWSNDIETMNGVSIFPAAGLNPWPGQAGWFDWFEGDFAEFDLNSGPGGVGTAYGVGTHNWYQNGGANLDRGTNFSKIVPSPLPNYNTLNTYGVLWVPATASTQGYMNTYFCPGTNCTPIQGTHVSWDKFNSANAPPPFDATTSYNQNVVWPNVQNGGGTGTTAFSILDQLHLALIISGYPGFTTKFASVQVWQTDGSQDLPVIATAAGKTPPPAPLTGTVTTQNWVAYDKSFSGVALACGKPFHFNVLPPAQYNPTSYIYPLYIWLHPDFQGDPWYTGGNTNPLFLTNDEAGSYNTAAFLRSYPAFYVAPYADQTNGNGSSCSGDGNDAVQNWGGWFNNGSTGSGTHYSGDTGPNTFALIQMILFLESTYSIDPNRIYCNGFSLGGIGCEYLMQHYNAYTGDKGHYFAAGASEAGVDQADTPVTNATANLMRTVPTWYFSGTGDTDSPPGAYNTPLCSALGGNPSALTAITSASANQCGASSMRYTLCPTCGHQDTDASGNPVWSNTTINTFLFAQSATGQVAPPPAEAITVSTIATQASATPFTVSGTITGLTTAPTLQYSVNGGTWLALPTSSGSRNAYNQPGSNASVWNTPFGSGAVWSNAFHTAICYTGTTTTGPCAGIINQPNNFGVTEYTSTSASDGTYSFSGPNGRTIAPDNSGTLSATMHIPSGAFNPGPYPGDNPFVLQDQTSFPNHQYTWSGITPAVQPPGLQPGQGPFVANEGAEWDDITSDTYGQDYDTGLSGYNLGDGVINACDVTPSCNPFYPQIKHGLRYMMPVTNFASNATTPGGQVLNPSGWPDRLQDAQTGANIYTGTLPFGTTLGIPATTAMPTGLDANCQGLFWTMQHYPLIPRDAAAGGLHLSVDQVAAASAYGTSITVCLPTLVNLLQVLTNQHQGGQSFTTNPANGPGTRTDTGPLPLSGGGGSNVTSTSYFFTEPGMAAGAANTISVRDANNTGTFGASNSFIVTGSTGGGVGAVLSAGYVNVAGSQFRDGSGNNERLACTGYSTPTGNIPNDMTLIRAQGFNCVQVPWFDKTTCAGGTCVFSSLDAIVSAANSVALRVVFIHQGNEGTNGSGSCTTQQANGLWYDVNGTAPWNATNGTDGCGTTGTVSYAQFKANWLQFATHYAGNTTVIGFDLHNEPTTFGNPACCNTAGSGGTGTGQFRVQAGKIVDPNGAAYVPEGINLPMEMAANLVTNTAAQPLTTLFPGINHVRLVIETGTPFSGYPTPASFATLVSRLTANKIVVEFDDHSCNGGALEESNGAVNPPPWCVPPTSGSALTTVTNWYTAMAQTYSNNPYVWFSSVNEPCAESTSCSYTAESVLGTYQLAIYNAVRVAGGANNMMQMLAGIGGGNCQTVGTNSSMTPASYAGMHNIIWELHSYYTGPGTQAGGLAQLTGSVATACGYVAAQSIQSADGIVPVIFGEWGTGSGVSTGADAGPFAQAMQSVAFNNGIGQTGWVAYAYSAQWQMITPPPTGPGPYTLTGWGQIVANMISATAGLSGTPSGGVGAVGAGWSTGNGGDLKAMTEDVGGAIQSADPGVLILVEGVLNNGTLFNGTARGSASLPITAGPISDLSTIGNVPVACCAGRVGYVVHDTPTDLSGVSPDSGNGATTMRNTAWGYLLTQNKAPVWIGKMGASLDNTNGNQADETAWATGLTQYMNGQLGAQGGPTFSGCSMPVSGDWFSFGNLAGQQPDGTLNPDNSNKSGQQSFWSTLLYTTCTNSNPGIGGTTWNPGDKSPAMTLSNGNLTATDTVTENSDSVRSTTAQSTGKVYFEVTATTSSTDWAAGLANSTFPLTLHAGLGGDGNGIGFYNVSPTQAIYFNSVSLAVGSSAGSTGDIIYFAADLTNHLFWVSSPVMRAASTPWNNSGSASPATGAGGLSFTGLTCPCFITFNDEEPGAATINAGGPFNGTVPAGFTAFQPSVTSGGRILLLNSLN